MGLGAAPYTARRLQDDQLFDTETQTLAARGTALRLRQDGDRARLTFKGPVIPAAVKRREEFETGVEDGATARRLLHALGFTPGFRYQKYREEFRLGDLIIAVDETPVGTFVEIEGDEAQIAAAATRLGRGAEDYIRASYRTLFHEYRQAHGFPSDDMVFERA